MLGMGLFKATQFEAEQMGVSHDDNKGGFSLCAEPVQ